MRNHQRARVTGRISAWNWAMLPDGIVGNILEKLQSEDAKAFRLVCSSWRDAHGVTVKALMPTSRQFSVAACARVFPFINTADVSGVHDEYLTEALRDLRELPFLRNLDLQNARALDCGDFEHLAQLSQLQTLNLRGQRLVSPAQLQRLASSLPALTTIDLGCCDSMTDEALLQLGKMNGLTSLRLADTDGVTDSGLRHLSGLLSLTDLDLTGCSDVTDTGIGHLTGLDQLLTVSLKCCDHVTDVGVSILSAACPRLTNLNLGCCQVSDEGLSAVVQHLTGLEALNLSWCDQLSDAGLALLAKLKRLRKLKLKGCTLLSDLGAGHLTALQNLEKLDLKLCVQLSEKALDSLRGQLQSCSIRSDSTLTCSIAEEAELEESCSDSLARVVGQPHAANLTNSTDSSLRPITAAAVHCR